MRAILAGLAAALTLCGPAIAACPDGSTAGRGTIIRYSNGIVAEVRPGDGGLLAVMESRPSQGAASQISIRSYEGLFQTAAENDKLKVTFNFDRALAALVPSEVTGPVGYTFTRLTVSKTDGQSKSEPGAQIIRRAETARLKVGECSYGVIIFEKVSFSGSALVIQRMQWSPELRYTLASETMIDDAGRRAATMLEAVEVKAVE